MISTADSRPLCPVFRFRLWTAIATIVLAGALKLGAAFYDPIVTGRASTLDYLDRTAALAGNEAFDDVPFQYILFVALRLGQIDRLTVDPNLFLGHIEDAVSVRDRFYANLTEDDFRTYLLPLRLRYEPLGRPNWHARLRAELDPLIPPNSTATDATAIVLQHLHQRIQLSDNRLTYPLRERFDQDPLSVWRGRRADEIDFSILAVAALRAVGIQARIVWVPAFSGLDGGKLWLEWRDENGGWIPWAPTGPMDTANHRAWLLNLAEGNWTIVLHSPDNPQEHTGAYCTTATVHTGEIRYSGMRHPTEGSLMVLNGHALQPVLAREFGLLHLQTKTARIAPGRIWICRGERGSAVGLLPWRLAPESPTWYVIDLSELRQSAAVAEKEPAFFAEARRSRPGSPAAPISTTAIRLPGRRALSLDEARADLNSAAYVRLGQPWNPRVERDIRPTGIRIGWRATDIEFLFEAETETPPANLSTVPDGGDAVRLLLWPENGTSIIDLTVSADHSRRQIIHHLDRNGAVDSSVESHFSYFDITQHHDPAQRCWFVHIRVPADRLGIHNLRANSKLHFTALRCHRREDAPPGISATIPIPVPDPANRAEWGTITLAQ